MNRSQSRHARRRGALAVGPLLTALVSLLAPAAAAAQPAALVKDAVTTGVNGPEVLLFSTLVVKLDGVAYFFADDGIHGRELWRSDGTAAGTAPLQDVNPGAGSASPGYFTTSGGRLFFTASDGERGFELWSMAAAPPRLVGSKTVSGDLRAGGHASYVITLDNPGDFDQHDNPGDELVDELPEGLAITAATADAGTVTVDPDGRTVRWNGAVPAGSTVTITIQAAIALDAAGTTLVNQAQIAYDADGSGDNETLAATDDPTAEGATDPTAFVAGDPIVVAVPTLAPAALALLALLLAAAGLLLSRRA